MGHSLPTPEIDNKEEKGGTMTERRRAETGTRVGTRGNWMKVLMEYYFWEKVVT